MWQTDRQMSVHLSTAAGKTASRGLDDIFSTFTIAFCAWRCYGPGVWSLCWLMLFLLQLLHLSSDHMWQLFMFVADILCTWHVKLAVDQSHRSAGSKTTIATHHRPTVTSESTSLSLALWRGLPLGGPRNYCPPSSVGRLCRTRTHAHHKKV